MMSEPNPPTPQKEYEDQVFLETKMYRGRASRSPLARFLNTFVVAVACLAGGLYLAIPRLAAGRIESRESMGTALFMAAVLIGIGAWSTVSSLRTYRHDRALARRRMAPPDR